MNSITITQDIESLRIASKILVDLFSNLELPNIPEEEWNQWKDWYLTQEKKFKEGQISIAMYFTQIKRIHTFLIEKASIPETDLFRMEITEREKVYDLTELESKKPDKLEEGEFNSLANILFDFYRLGQSDLKANPQIETAIMRKRDKFFDRNLILNIEDEITAIESGDYSFNSDDEKKCLLGELFIQNGNLTKASEVFESISAPRLKKSKILTLTLANGDFNVFKSLLQEAYPETFKPEYSGRYILSFLLGNEWFYRYEIDSSNRRCISFLLSSGIYQISKMDVFNAFIEDIRYSPDGRLGLWGIRAEKLDRYKIEDVRHLDFKQRIGWRAT